MTSVGFPYFLDRILQFGLEYFGIYYGIYRARVKSNEDNDNRGQPDPFGRLTVYVPSVGDTESTSRVAWPIAPAAGGGWGFKTLPPAESNVYVIFEGGRLDAALWIGGWWARGQIPSELNKAETNWWITPGGHQVVMDDQDGAEVIRVKHSDGSTRIELDKDGNVFIVNKSGSKVHIGDGAENEQPTQPGVLGEKLKGLMEDLITAINAMTVPTPAGPSGTPINSAQFESVKGRLQTMLSETVDLK